MDIQQAWHRQNNFENVNTVEGHRLPAFKTYEVTDYKATTVAQNTAMDEWRRTQNPGTYLHSYTQLLFKSYQGASMGGKKSSQ